jgi:polysaccharide export outer membrane protein
MTILKFTGNRLAAAAIAGLLGVITLTLLGCSNEIANAPGVAIPPEARKRQATGNIGPGDVLSVSYAGAPEMNLTQKVRANGRISLPMLGDVQAAGKSLSSFQSSLASSYKKHLQEPKVVVTMVSTAAAVYIAGEVRGPGKILLDRPLTALEAIMESGGFAPTADPKKVSVVRTIKGTHQRYNLNMTEALSGTAPVFYLKPYDVIYVGQRVW